MPNPLRFLAQQAAQKDAAIGGPVSPVSGGGAPPFDPRPPIDTRTHFPVRLPPIDRTKADVVGQQNRNAPLTRPFDGGGINHRARNSDTNPTTQTPPISPNNDFVGSLLAANQAQPAQQDFAQVPLWQQVREKILNQPWAKTGQVPDSIMANLGNMPLWLEAIRNDPALARLFQIR